jgi:hypothetical protein
MHFKQKPARSSRTLGCAAPLSHPASRRPTRHAQESQDPSSCRTDSSSTESACRPCPCSTTGWRLGGCGARSSRKGCPEKQRCQAWPLRNFMYRINRTRTGTAFCWRICNAIRRRAFLRLSSSKRVREDVQLAAVTVMNVDGPARHERN